MTEPLPEGVYERLRTSGLDATLAGHPHLVPHFADVEEADQPHVLARHVAVAFRRVLESETDPERRIALTNEVLTRIAAAGEDLDGRIEQLVVLSREIAPGVHRLVRPRTSLSAAALMTNTPGEPSLSAELRSELTSADAVDLLCAFIRWPGLRLLHDELGVLRDRGVALRVITTTYMGATEQRAVDELVRRFGATVRINYASATTRLHAKAWLFRRGTGFDTAFVGSSNLSRSALVDGLEWNVRLSAVATPDLIRKFTSTFDTYWADPAFVPYDPDNADDAARLADALGRARTPSADRTPTGLEVRPLPHQSQILEALDTEREVHGRHRNLVVAATGTGKTVVAALDYARLRRTLPRARLLFVAHRKEILDQSRRTYRAVLADGAFGEHYVGGERPERWNHVFASVQALGAYGVERIPPDHFDVVVVDEFHHAEAAGYRRLLAHLTPRELLGLTATPERADGADVRDQFGGRCAAELRLWDALADDLLVPFHYFGIADDVDLSGVEWKRGGYDAAALDALYTGNDARAAKVVRETRDKVTDVQAMRALGFCVSVEHAEYMAEVFTRAGIASLAVSGRTPAADRARALRRLAAREVNCLFTVDLFNEGLDLPEVDTILMLRPTQSATVFLQQLGRGLRRAPGKAVLTALDFIGQQRREFRFDVRYRALTGSSRRGLAEDIEQSFPFLPSGSALVLDRVAQQIVLDNVRRRLRLRRRDLVADIRSHGDLALAGYLRAADREPADVYRDKGSWTALRRDAGLPTLPPGPDEDALLRRMATLSHVDDPERAQVYTALADPSGPGYHELTEREQRLARMLFFQLWPNRNGFTGYDQGLAHLRRHPAVCAEIAELVAYTLDTARHLPRSLGEGLTHIPLASHAHYRREEILAALDWAGTARKASGHATGVVWAPEHATDALLVNLRKTERDFSPSTMYRDFAVSPEVFHWESQNATSLRSDTGQRYVHHRERATRVVLFTRDAPSDDLGPGAPFLCLGQVDIESHRGERPIAITWRLRRPMPAETFRIAGVAAS
ncbi:type III restriction protein res subunit [Pseudonocardia dioxanivorans CB1190]|uniref:Type III restriction protein res subunit n=1 Tax=Pseudonocardia dioxanivorans (strain ATCC 55486 / DSM 44775 / JCM 13855 / CB1190) TaxID=675635 RepID=F4CRM1_PSEUX|nr:DEAD/DEAH box helicase [Pseudonocardia dioxanivorans]AEA26229.1 type III restriction protein res subunit [Pseudonocardia dioxanivorans CB1190]